VQSKPDFRLRIGQQFLRNAQALSRYDEVPMAGVVRIVMFVITRVVGFVNAVALAGVIIVIMVLILIQMPM
jgi:hypothetical protein